MGGEICLKALQTLVSISLTFKTLRVGGSCNDGQCAAISICNEITAGGGGKGENSSPVEKAQHN